LCQKQSVAALQHQPRWATKDAAPKATKLQKIRTADPPDERPEYSSGTPVITFGILACAGAMVLVLAVAFAAAM
jgi:hypothetical protein